MSLNQFINTGADGATVNDMKKSIAREDDLQKAMNKAGLVQKDVQVQGKNGQTFTRKQWVKASDAQQSQQKTSSSNSPIKSDYSKLTSEKESNTIAGEAHNMMVGYLKHNGIDAKDSKAIKKAAMEMAKQYQDKANKKDAHPDDKKHNRKLSDEFSRIAASTEDFDKFSASNFKILKENLADFGFKLDSADLSDIESGNPPDTVTIFKGKEKFTATFNKYGDGGCEVINLKPIKNSQQDSSSKIDISSELNQVKQKSGESDEDYEDRLDTELAENHPGMDIDTRKTVIKKYLQSKSSKQQNSARFKPSDFQFRAGGQEVADIVNEANEKFGVKKHSNGQVGFGTLNLNNGENINFGYDDKGAYLQWQGQKFRSADELNTQWSGGKKTQSTNPQTGVKDKPKATMIENYFAGNHSHEDSKKALAGLLGKGYTREDIMAQAEKSGVTWKKNDHAGINWMRASMAIQKHLESQK